jgi:hypothetical protein
MTAAVPLPLPDVDRLPRPRTMPTVRAINAAIARCYIYRRGRPTYATVRGLTKRISGARRRHGRLEVRLVETSRWVFEGVSDIHIG